MLVAIMPTDFTSAYLLSCSPPGFDIPYNLRDQYVLEAVRSVQQLSIATSSQSSIQENGQREEQEFDETLHSAPIKKHHKHNRSRKHLSSKSLADFDEFESSLSKSNSLPELAKKLNGEDSASDVESLHKSDSEASLTDGEIDDFLSSIGNDLSSDELKDGEERYNLGRRRSRKSSITVIPPSVSKKGLPKKRVMFADDVGGSLESVRYLKDDSDTPPQFAPHVWSKIRKNLPESGLDVVSANVALILNFSQPASDYFAFREKLEKLNVSLENAIVKENAIIGTIKVKNLSFEKSVLLRCTYDSWENFVDIPAYHVANGLSGIIFDTFSFMLEVPAETDHVHKKVQFAVCYRTNQKEFWDSNDGVNYEILSVDQKMGVDDESTSLHACQTNFGGGEWTEFSSWSARNSAEPYW